MKRRIIFVVFVSGVILIGAIVRALLNGGHSAQAHSALPPKIESFLNFESQQASEIARNYNFALPDDFKKFLADAREGKVAATAQFYNQFLATMNENGSGNIAKSPIIEVARDVLLASEAYSWDSNSVTALGRDLMNSLPANCVFFGGTDPGRGLATALCNAPGNPFFVLTQNALCDRRYLQYARELYGTRLQLPTTNDLEKCLADYSADAQQRMKENKLEPGEDVRLAGGKLAIQGNVAVMKANSRVVKWIFDHNPDRDFFLEQSYPLDWTYPYLSPHGLILKINRKPLALISPDEVKADDAYWSQRLAALKHKSPTGSDIYARQAYAKLRSATGDLYRWRADNAAELEEYRRMIAAAEHAFEQALAIYPVCPEAVCGACSTLWDDEKYDAAAKVAKEAAAADPSNEQFSGWVKQFPQAPPKR